VDELPDVNWAESDELACPNGWDPWRLTRCVVTNPSDRDTEPLCYFRWSHERYEVIAVCRVQLFRLRPQSLNAPLTH
jgi:hypothetical protein